MPSPPPAPVHPSILRNRDPILDALRPVLAPSAAADLLLEVAAGSGDHAAWLAPHFPHLRWLPTDLSLARFAPASPLPANVLAPTPLDAAAPPAQWPVPPGTRLRAILAINLTHISPWAATLGLFRAARHHLCPVQGRLCVYGPFLLGADSTPGNVDFDAVLRAQDPAWGVRELDAVLQAAQAAGLEAQSVRAMPANNRLLVFGVQAQ